MLQYIKFVFLDCRAAAEWSFFMNKQKKACLFTVLAFILAQLIVYCLFHIPNFVLMQTTDAIEYTRRFLVKFCDFLMPIVAATVLFVGYNKVPLKTTLIRAIFLSLPRMIYSLPYYYLYFWANFYDSIEAISLSALVTLFGVCLFYGQVLLLLWLMRSFARLPIVKKYKKELPINEQKKTPKNILLELRKKADAEVESTITDRSLFNFSSPSTLGIFSAVFGSFCINFAREAIDTITYLFEYAGDYLPEEIIYVTFCYIFLVTELLLCQAICCAIRNLITKEKARKIEE